MHQYNQCQKILKSSLLKDYNNEKERKKKASNRISNKIENNEVNVPSTLEYKYVLADLVDLLNKLPDEYYNDFKSWMTITSALKSVNLKDVWDTFSKKSDKYDELKNKNIWDGLTPYADLTILSIIRKKENIKSKFKVHRWCNKLELFTTKPNEIRNEKYLTLTKFDYDEHPRILIKSATGTEKTTCTAEMIENIRKWGDYKVLSIVSRVS